MQKNVHIPQQNGGAAERDYIIRPIRPKECADAFNLLATNGEWNLTLIKFKKVVEVFPSNIFVMIKRGTQEVVATCSATPTFPGQCVLGNLVVRLDHRSRGLGKSMCLHMTDIVQRIRSSTATLTAVPGVALFYSNLGFQTIQPSHYVNFVTVDRARVHKACSGRNLDNNNIVISNYTPDMFQALNRYDTQARGYDCGKYLSVMTHASDTFVIATRRDSDQVVVVGYAAGVLELSYLLVDGLYADDDDIALHLYGKLLDLYPDKEVTKLQEIKPRCFLSQFGEVHPKSHKYTRMSIGPKPANPDLSKLYVVCDCDYTE